MKGFKSSIEKDTIANKDFRHVLYTGKHSQLVMMSLRAGEDIGMEVHPAVDQFFRFEKGRGVIIIDGASTDVKEGDAAIVPAGAQHNVVNTNKSEDLKLYTIYSPPEHIDGTIRRTKADAAARPEEFNGKTTE